MKINVYTKLGRQEGVLGWDGERISVRVDAPPKDGGFNRHVYYHCTKKVDPNCPEKYINEKDLITQLAEFIAQNSDSIEIRSDLEKKVERHAQIVSNVMYRYDQKQSIKPLAEYSSFILNTGSYSEKAELIEGIKNTFVIRNA